MPLEPSATRLSELVRELGERSPLLAQSCKRAIERTTAPFTTDQLERWIRTGLVLAGGGWKSANLACKWFDDSETLLRFCSFDDFERFSNILCRIAGTRPELAASCLQAAPSIFGSLPHRAHAPFLELAETIVERHPADIWSCFDQGSTLLVAMGAIDPGDLVSFVTGIMNHPEAPSFGQVLEVAEKLASIDSGRYPTLFSHASTIATRDPLSAAAFVTTLPELERLLPEDKLDEWVQRGLSQSATDDRQASLNRRAYFRLDSIHADEVLAALSGRVEFRRVAHVLQLFAQAVGGEDIQVRPMDAPDSMPAGRGMAAQDQAHIILVPDFIDAFDSRQENFDAYKVCIAHQAGRRQFKSFEYDFGVNGAFLASTARRRQEGDDRARSRAPMQRFFDLFHDTALIAALFSLVEGARVDLQVVIEYPGLKRALANTRAHEARKRPFPGDLPLREAFVENLIHASLGSLATSSWPASLVDILGTAIGVLRIAIRPSATVQDSAEASAWLFDVADMLPNIVNAACPRPWRSLTEAELPILETLPPLPPMPSELLSAGPLLTMHSPEPPRYRGHFRPEPVQAFEMPGQEDLDESVTANHAVQAEEGEGEATGQLIPGGGDEAPDDAADDAETGMGDEAEPEASEAIAWHSYDEWDFRIHGYLADWCRVGERPAPHGEPAYYEDTLSRHHALVTAIRRQFEMMRPESRRKVKNLHDGHDIDLERAVRFVVDRKAGAGPSARFYTRTDKVERSVAAALLLDMSHSTSELVDAAHGQRIIDIERDTVVLLIEALEAIGDTYGIFGFSGHGRHDVAFYPIKELDEALRPDVKARVDGIAPDRSTRMGAAIRHTRTKLDACPSAAKLLILLSDGRPQDQGYGEAGNDFEYGVHDTRQALIETARAGIVPFLITVDREGPDYLKALCGDMGYEVVKDITSLPSRLPAIYRYLAGN